MRREPRPRCPKQELRVIQAVASDRIPGELLDLAQALADRYLCSLESCLRLVAPVGSVAARRTEARPRKDWVVRTVTAGPEIAEKLTPKQAQGAGGDPRSGRLEKGALRADRRRSGRARDAREEQGSSSSAKPRKQSAPPTGYRPIRPSGRQKTSTRRRPGETTGMEMPDRLRLCGRSSNRPWRRSPPRSTNRASRSGCSGG